MARSMSTSQRDDGTNRNGDSNGAEHIEFPTVRTPPELVDSRGPTKLPRIRPLDEHDPYVNSFDPSQGMFTRSLATNPIGKAQVTSNSDLWDEHVHITAHLYGWNSVRDQFPDPVLERLQAADELMMPFKDFATRLSSVVIMASFWKVGSMISHLPIPIS